MRRLIKKTLKGLLLFVAGLVTLIVGFVVAALLRPSLVLNNQTLRLAVWYLNTQQHITVSWNHANLNSNYVTFWEKELVLAAEALCAFKKTPPNEIQIPYAPTYADWKVCSQTTNLDIIWNLKNGIPTSLGNLPRQGNLRFGESSAAFGLTKLGGTGALSYHDPYFVKANVRMNLGEGNTIAIVADTQGIEKEGMKFFVDVKYIEKAKGRRSRKIDGRLEGIKYTHRIDAEVFATALDLDPAMKKINTKGCKIALFDEGNFQHAKLGCPVNIVLNLPKAGGANYSRLIKPSNQLVLGVNLKRERIAADSKPVGGAITLEVDPIFPGQNEGRGGVSINVDGLLNDFPNGWTFDAKGNIEVKNFQKIVKMLSKTDLEIPAPFNSLNGKIAFSYGGKAKYPLKDMVVGFTLNTDLSSPTQSLVLNSAGDFKMGTSFLKAKVELAKVKLVLPDIEYRTPPAMLPDARFEDFRSAKKESKAEGKQGANKSPGFTYDISLFTAKGKPLHLVAPVAMKPVPIEVNMHLASNSPATGSVRVATFPLKLFRRSAKVEYFQLIAATTKTETEVKGKINFYYTDYTISLLVDGLLDRPRTRIISEPPLPEKQALAVFLFGRTLDELDPDQISSVGNTTAAFTDGAISLASMYALASTPVESVGYDSSTRLFSAKLKLADGTSLNVKSDATQVRQLGVRKRLGPHLGIHSYFEDPFEASKRSLTTLLEWHFIY